jgi:hypothetical protein
MSHKTNGHETIAEQQTNSFIFIPTKMTQTTSAPKKTSTGNKIKALIKNTPSQTPKEKKPAKKREPVKDKEEWDKKPIFEFNRSAHTWKNDSIYMSDDEFRVVMLPRMRILHEETIGWIVSEDDDTYKKSYESIGVVIYGTDGIKTTSRQATIYAFYVRYRNYVWSAWNLISAFKIVESIRAGKVLEEQKEIEWKKKWNARQKARKAKLRKQKATA